MKQYCMISLILLVGWPLCGSQCSIDIKPQWQSLERANTRAATFGGKWILIGSIIFRKKCKDVVKLDQLTLEWNGPMLEQITGSLYKKNPSKEFVPIEDNLLSDGTWNKTTQQLSFEFDEHTQTLGPLSIFYVVLTVPDGIESVLSQGYFSILKTQLPYLFKEEMKTAQLNLTLHCQPTS